MLLVVLVLVPVLVLQCCGSCLHLLSRAGPGQPPTSLATAGRAPNSLSTSRAAQRGRCPAQTALGHDAGGGAGFFLPSMLEMARRHPPQYGGSAVSTLITSQFSRILALVPCSLGRLFSFVLCSVLSCSAAPACVLISIPSTWSCSCWR